MKRWTFRIKITYKTLYGISLVLFFAQDAFRVLLAAVLPFLSYDMTVRSMIVLMYTPLIIALIIRKEDTNYLIRFFICLSIVVLVFGVTYIIHPEYSYWFFEGSYPIWDRIFRPNQFLYAFLFVSAVGDPDELIKYMKMVAYILLLYYSYRLLRAQMLGYWITTTTASGPSQTAYDLNYGYDHLLVLAVFVCCAFKEGKKRYLFLAGVSFVEILLGGSRGPLIGVAILLLIIYFRYKENFNKWMRILIFTLFACLVIIYLFFGIHVILNAIGTVLEQVLGETSSRTLSLLIEGEMQDILNDSGRTRLYNMAIEMIKDGFWGYGVYGDRYIIGRVYWVGYCHNIFLELLIDFGWIIGGIFCVIGISGTLKMLIACKNESWWSCFVIFLIPSTKLLLSGSYWYLEAFWACIAIYFMYRKCIRSERTHQWNQKAIISRSKAL